MRLYSIILCILFLFSCSKKRQENLTNTIFNKQDYKTLSPDKKIFFLDSLTEKINELPTTIGTANYLLDLSTEYYFLNNSDKALNISRSALRVSKILNDTLSIAKSYNYIGDSYNQTYKDSAFAYYQNAEKLYKFIGNDELQAKMLFKKAYILFFEGNYIESEVIASHSLQLIKYSNSHEMAYMVYNLMGCNLEKLDDYDNSLKYFSLAEKELFILNKQDVDFNQKFNYNVVLSINKANVYDKKKEYTKSIQELNTVLNNDIATKWPMNFAIALGNLGYSKMKKGDLNIVEPIMIKSLKLSLIHNNQSDVVNKLINLGEYYLIKKDTTKSRDYLNKALVLGNKIKASNELKLVYDLLSKAEPQRDSYYKGKIIRLTDSLAVVQRKNRNKYARIEYETAVVEDANKELSSKNLYLIFGVVILVAALGVRYVIGQRKEIAYRKQLQAAELELFDLMRSSQVALNSAREEEQNRISRELHDNVMNKLYGTRLQLGMLNSPSIPDVEVKRLEQIDVLQTIEQDIRAISHDLHTDVVASHFDYPVLLAQCVQQLSSTTQTNLHLDCAAGIDWESVSGLVKITLYRMVQEALSNVVKYAAATDCHITIGQADASTLLLTLRDTGKGFDLATASSGIGLKNMRDRARLVKADFHIESVIGQGTRIECKFVI